MSLRSEQHLVLASDRWIDKSKVNALNPSAV